MASGLEELTKLRRATGPGLTAAPGTSQDGETGEIGHNQTTQDLKMGMVIITWCSRAIRLETSTGQMMPAPLRKDSLSAASLSVIQV